MKEYNNMKRIREIYGATQEEIAKVAGVNRSTVAQWESGAITASNTKLEKLSLFYGLGPECFYDIPEIDEQRRNMLVDSARKAREIEIASENRRNKADEFNQLLESISFIEARNRFMFSMKLLLATADDGELEDLKVAHQITKKMEKRLDAFIRIREEEEKAKK